MLELVDDEAEAHRLWLELVTATHRLHLDLQAHVRAGRLSLDPFGTLGQRLAEADAALDAWSEATERCDRLDGPF
jgi:hypothetical protein